LPAFSGITHGKRPSKQSQRPLAGPAAEPQQVKDALPLTESAQATVLQGRETVRRILDREDPRLFVVIGPCSIHDIKAAKSMPHRN
jgi:3-deoxy-7-phosphoheptulonate synthase